MATALTRNAPCLCGSGTKAKKCHPEFIGQTVESLKRFAAGLAATRAAEARTAEHLAFFEQCDGYVPPADGSDGWSRDAWRRTGCPFADWMDPREPACTPCNRDSDAGCACAAGCGV